MKTESCGALERISARLEALAEREGYYDNSEIIALLRKHMFADVDELEQSGDLKFPEPLTPSLSLSDGARVSERLPKGAIRLDTTESDR